MNAVKKIASKEGCSDMKSSNIACQVYHWLLAKKIGVSIDDYSKIKDLDAHGTSGKDISDITGVPLQKVYKIMTKW